MRQPVHRRKGPEGHAARRTDHHLVPRPRLALVELATARERPCLVLVAGLPGWAGGGLRRLFALTALTCTADTYNQSLAHNVEFYVRPDDGRVVAYRAKVKVSFKYETE